jgi:adenylylsulfate kinase
VSPRALLLTGTVGVGKTTVAAGDLLREREVDLGFSTLVLAGVLETAEDPARHAEAVRVPLTVCRLVADPGSVHRRLHDRHRDDPDGLGWHLHRADELAAIQDASTVEDLRLDVTALAVVEAASRVLGHWDV